MDIEIDKFVKVANGIVVDGVVVGSVSIDMCIIIAVDMDTIVAWVDK